MTVEEFYYLLQKMIFREKCCYSYVMLLIAVPSVIGPNPLLMEWWLSRSFSGFYRTWNIVVHDWLYTYIYKDMYEIIRPGDKSKAKLTVFLISAVVHEWLLINALGLFFPIQFAQFFLGGALLTLINCLHVPIGNLTVWYAIIFGAGVQTNFYTLEFMARRNCPLENQTTVDFFTPRFLNCDCIQ